MRLISSSLTLVLGIFIPVFWVVFFGSLCLFSWLTDDQDLPLRNPFAFRIQLSVVFVLGCVIVLTYLIRLKRVEIDEEYFYITNYFKTVKIPIRQCVHISTKKFLGRFWVTLQFDLKSTFGNRVKLICNQQSLDFLEEKIQK